MIMRCRKISPGRSRRAAAVVELALLLPVLSILLLGVLETSQAMRVSEILTEASRNGCSSASYPNQTNSDVCAEIQTVLTNSGLPSKYATVKILINDVEGSLDNAKRNDKITVIVAMPWSSVNYSKTNCFFFGNSMLTESTTMLKLA